MKGLNTSQYKVEKDGEGVSKHNEENIHVGRGVKKSSLHGQHTLENKRKFSDNEPNHVDIEENMGLDVRKAVVLDYMEGGGDGKGDQIAERIGKFKADNPEWIEHKEVDELYPTASQE